MIDIERVVAVTPNMLLFPGPSEASDIDLLYAQGCRWIIDVRAEYDDTSIILASHPDIEYLWNPTQDDGTTKPPTWFESSYQFAKPYLVEDQVGGPHCAAECNRGPSTAYYLLRRHPAWALSPAAAEAAIRSVRPSVGIRYKGDADAAIAVYGQIQ